MLQDLEGRCGETCPSYLELQQANETEPIPEIFPEWRRFQHVKAWRKSNSSRLFFLLLVLLVGEDACSDGSRSC
jgi:hypothetical protein